MTIETLMKSRKSQRNAVTEIKSKEENEKYFTDRSRKMSISRGSSQNESRPIRIQYFRDTYDQNVIESTCTIFSFWNKKKDMNYDNTKYFPK